MIENNQLLTNGSVWEKNIAVKGGLIREKSVFGNYEVVHNNKYIVYSREIVYKLKGKGKK